jgi:predicted hydrocarbon binding protein
MGVLKMAVTIRLMVKSGSGVLAAVVSQLQASGIRVKSHNIAPINSDSAMLTLNADAGGGFDEGELKSKLAGIEVVQNVEEISSEQGVAAAKQPDLEVSEELVNRIVAAFPRIMSHIQNYEEQIANDRRRVEKLKRVGVEAGMKFAPKFETDSPESIPDVIDEVVLPGIGSIAEASRDGDAVVVPISLFTRRMVTSMDLFSGEGENCYFLSGFIEGLAASLPGHESVSVAETKCRANGDPACVFKLS